MRWIAELDRVDAVRSVGAVGGYMTVMVTWNELGVLWAPAMRAGSTAPKKIRYGIAFLTFSLYHFTLTILKFFFQVRKRKKKMISMMSTINVSCHGNAKNVMVLVTVPPSGIVSESVAVSGPNAYRPGQLAVNVRS